MNKDVFFRLTTSAGPRKTFCVLMRNRTSDFKFLPKKRADLRPPKHKCISAGTTISISNHNSARTNSSIVYSMQIIIHCKKKKKIDHTYHTFFFLSNFSFLSRPRQKLRVVEVIWNVWKSRKKFLHGRLLWSDLRLL